MNSSFESVVAGKGVHRTIKHILNITDNITNRTTASTTLQSKNHTKHIIQTDGPKDRRDVEIEGQTD